MARKILVVLMITVTMCITGLSVTKADVGLQGGLQPDIVSDKIIILSSDPQLLSGLKNGTFAIVTFSSKYWLGFDVPGGNSGMTDVVITKQDATEIPLTQGVALQLINGKLFVYLTKYAVLALPWNNLSIAHIDERQYVTGEIVKMEYTGAWEQEKDYCCNPPVIKKSFFYKIYLASKVSPYEPAEESDIDIIVGLMIPDYMVEIVKASALNHDQVYISLCEIYIWVLH